MMTNRNNKITVVATVLLVACMAAAVEADEAAIDKFCGATRYKGTCVRSLSKANSTQPKDLMKAAFNTAVSEVESAIKGTALYQRAKLDKMTHAALAVCEDLLTTAVEDLKRSFDKVDKLEIGTLKYNVADVRNWLSATITYKDTCVDAFENTTGDTGKKVKEILKTSGKLLSNGLSMITAIQNALEKLDLGALESDIKNRTEHHDFGAIASDIKNHTEKDLGAIASDIKSHTENDLGALASDIKTHTGSDLGAFVSDLKDHAERKLLGDEEEEEEGETHHPRMLLAGDTMTPDVTVAQDGSGQFKSVVEAVNSLVAAKLNKKPIVMKVKAGVYAENVVIPKDLKNLLVIGDGPLKTIITGSKSYAKADNVDTSGTFIVLGDGFMAQDIAFENTATVSQAVALRVMAGFTVFYNCHMNGYQDTLYSQTYRQFYRECLISGNVDFVFGNAISVFQKCEFVVRNPNPTQGAAAVTAQGRNVNDQDGVIVIQGSHVKGDDAYLQLNPRKPAFLGRPWKDLSRTIVMQTEIDGVIHPEGWELWDGSDKSISTLYYAEWGNKGAGSNLATRVNWPGYQKGFTQEQARAWVPKNVFVDDSWIVNSGVPYDPEFMNIPTQDEPQHKEL